MKFEQTDYSAWYYNSMILTGQYFKMIHSKQVLYKKYGGEVYSNLTRNLREFIGAVWDFDLDDPWYTLYNSYNTLRILVDVLYLNKRVIYCGR